MTIEQRFFDKVQKTDACWLWLGCSNDAGYGYFRDKKTMYAHRYSYNLHKGKIPEGLSIDHICRNKSCVNPDHLEVVTYLENHRRNCKSTRKLKCKNGHIVGTNNTFYDSGHLRCKICEHEKYKKNKELVISRVRLRRLRLREETRKKIDKMVGSLSQCVY